MQNTQILLQSNQAIKTLPKHVEHLFAFFPLLHSFLSIFFCILAFKLHSFFWFVSIFNIYLLPPFLWRLLQLNFTLVEGSQVIGVKSKHTSMWFISYWLQYSYMVFPFFERALMLIPGLYSQWLRIWGSKIGKNVYWHPRVTILDRMGLQIGDWVSFGDQVYLSCHLVRRKNGVMTLLYRPISIGHKVLVGFSSHLGPGTVLPSNFMLPYYSRTGLGKIKGGNNESC